MLCQSGACYVDYSDSLLSSDKTKIYSFAAFGSSPTYLYFTTFNQTNGNVLGSRYKSSDQCSVSGATIKDDSIIIATYCTINSYAEIILYNTVNSAFTIKENVDIIFYGIGIDSYSKRVLAFGTKLNKGYISMFTPESFVAHPHFTSTSLTMSVLSTGIEDIISETGMTISSTTTQSVTSTSFSNQVVTYVLNPSDKYTSDVNFQTDNQQISILENSTSKIYPDLCCSSTGSTSITYVDISDYNGVNKPSWVSIDSNTGQLTIGAPIVAIDETYLFYINSLISGVSVPIQKVIQLTIINCRVQNCMTCSATSGLICNYCNSGYNLSSNQCILQYNTSSSTNDSDLVQSLKITILSIIGMIVIITLIMRMFEPFFVSNLYSTLNQSQLLLFLLLTKASLPNDIQKVIGATKVILNPFAYIPYKNIYYFKSLINSFYYDPHGSIVDALPINSESTLYNLYPFLLLLLIFALIHLLIFGVKLLLENCTANDYCLCFINFLKDVTIKAYQMMTYGLYIRLILFMYNFMLIASVYEIYEFNTINSSRLASLVFAFSILLVLLALIGLTFYLALSSYALYDDQHNKIGELFRDLHMRKLSKLYKSVSLIREGIFVLILITLMETPSKIAIIILSAGQLIYTAWMVYVRPYKSVQCNIIEILNEMYLVFLLSSLICLNTESQWNSVLTNIYLWIIVSNLILSSLTILIGSIKILVNKCKKRCRDENENNGNSANVIRIIPKSKFINNTSNMREESKNEHIQYKRRQLELDQSNKISINISENSSNVEIVRKKNWD